MPNYDFKQLSPHDFELLTRDLIQARDSVILESFKIGRDLGIDFRHARATGNTIIQCKHYAGTGLMADLKKEAVKVARLKPARYILVTSVGLTPSNKTDIQALFGDVLATGDILGPWARPRISGYGVLSFGGLIQGGPCVRVRRTALGREQLFHGGRGLSALADGLPPAMSSAKAEVHEPPGRDCCTAQTSQG